MPILIDWKYSPMLCRSIQFFCSKLFCSKFCHTYAILYRLCNDYKFTENVKIIKTPFYNRIWQRILVYSCTESFSLQDYKKIQFLNEYLYCNFAKFQPYPLISHLPNLNSLQNTLVLIDILIVYNGKFSVK